MKLLHLITSGDNNIMGLICMLAILTISTIACSYIINKSISSLIFVILISAVSIIMALVCFFDFSRNLLLEAFHDHVRIKVLLSTIAFYVIGQSGLLWTMAYFHKKK